MSEQIASTPECTKGLSRLPFSFSREYLHWIRVVVLAAADVFAFFLATMLFRVGHTVPELVFLSGGVENQTPLDIFVILGSLFILVRYLSGDYSQRHLFWAEARVTTLAIFVASVPDLIIFGMFSQRYTASAEIGSWVFLLVSIPVLRYIARCCMAYAGIWRVPTALVGVGRRVNTVHTAVSKALSLGFDIRWLVLDNTESNLPEKLPNVKCLYISDADDIAEQMAQNGCSQVVISTDDMQSATFANLIQRLMERNISVAFIPSFLRLPLVRVTTSYFFGHDILLFQVRNSLWRIPHRFVKRTFDLVGSIGLLLLFSPVFVAISLAIKAHDGGNVTYAQRRVGRYGREFSCLKFRTMAEDADERRAKWEQENPELYAEFLKTYKLRDDPRVTKPGKWLRKTSLDELPQLLNVLWGQMSLVGPRPIPMQQLLDQYGPAARLYMQVRPGLTGLWQISGRNDTTLDQRVVYDEWYILNWSFWYDIVILMQTAWIVLTGRGAY